MEINDIESLSAYLEAGDALAGVRIQDLDLTVLAPLLLAREDLAGLVVLGGVVPEALGEHLRAHRAVVFPAAPEAPVDVFRARLYTAAELYEGLDGEEGYAGTPDARAYEWSRDARLARDAYVTLLRAIHDDSPSSRRVRLASGAAPIEPS